MGERLAQMFYTLLYFSFIKENENPSWEMKAQAG